MSFTLNGKPMGVAFSDVDVRPPELNCTERSGSKSATLFRRLFLMTARGRGFVLVVVNAGTSLTARQKKLINFMLKSPLKFVSPRHFAV